MDHSTADSTPLQAPTLPRRPVAVDAEIGRLSALTAPQREAVDAFLAENRVWALRQARRSYRHLPESLREQAVDRAFTELRTRAPRSLERRALAGELAERLTESLRHVHVGWCLNESSALLRREGTEPVQPEVRRDGLADFVDEGLGGLERAVLQLEIGAGRDTRTSRAALRLGPRQYAAHREAGLSKLRDAISAQIIGRACDQHVSAVVSAATGDRAAMDGLTAGEQRCRFCAREAQGLRSVLHERLAVAPWPIAIAPAGAVASKLGVLGGLFGGKSAGTAGLGALGAGGTGASAAATVLAAAALATGTAALVDGDDAPEKLRRAAPAAEVVKGSVAKRAGGSGSASLKGKKSERVAARTSGRKADPSASVATPETPVAASGQPAAPATPAVAEAPAPADKGPVTAATKPVTDTVDQTVNDVTNVIPGPVGDTVDGLTDTVDDVTGVVDGVLPKP